MKSKISKEDEMNKRLEEIKCRVKEWRVALGIPLAVSAVSSFVPV